MAAPTPLPTLPATWFAPSQCVTSTAYYYMVVSTYTRSDGGGIIFNNLFGIPTAETQSVNPSGTCVPPNFTTNVPYVTDGGCPTGYSAACLTGTTYQDKPASQVTCCPSGVFEFTCQPGIYGCQLDVSTDMVVTGTRTDIALTPPTQQPETRTPAKGEIMNAWGIKMVSTVPTSTEVLSTTGTSEPSPSATDTTRTNGPDTDESESSGGISSGAAAGAGVGAGLAFICIAFAAWLFYRKWKAKNSGAQHQQKQQNPYAPASSGLYDAQYQQYGRAWGQENKPPPHYYPGHNASPPPSELHNVSRAPQELQ